MTRLKSIPVAIGAIVLSTGTVFGFAALPQASAPGLAKASAASGQTVPRRGIADGGPNAVAPEAAPAVTDLPDAAGHGAAVSAAAKATDTTPDTNHGADVSAVARDNHGQAIAATHTPADAGKPDGVGKPTDPGKPDDPGAPGRP